MFKAIVQMLDGSEKLIQVSPVTRDGLKFAPPLTLHSSWGTVKYMGKQSLETPVIYQQLQVA